MAYPQQQRFESDPERSPRQAEGSDSADMADDPEQALESGEPKETGRSHGRIIDGKGGSTEHTEPGRDEHWESGRQQAN